MVLVRGLYKDHWCLAWKWVSWYVSRASASEGMQLLGKKSGWAHVQLGTCIREGGDNGAAPQLSCWLCTSRISDTEWQGSWGSMGPSNAGGQQACFLQERLWLLVLSREAKELRKCGQHETKCWLWIHCLQEQLEWSDLGYCPLSLALPPFQVQQYCLLSSLQLFFKKSGAS